MSEHPTIKEIKSGKIFPLYLFFGSEEFLIEDVVNQTINVLVDPSSKDFNLNIYNASDSSPAVVLDTIRTLPFMSERRLVILKKVDLAGKAFMDNKNFLNYLESPYKETCLIVTAENIDKRKKFYTLISKAGKAVHFQKFKSFQTVSWISKRAKEKGYKVESSSAKFIADVFDNNLNRIDNELEKIFLYCGEEKSIDLALVQLVAGNPKVDSIFALTSAIGEKKIGSSVSKMENLLLHGALPLQTLGMITRQYRLIWQAKVLVTKRVSPSEIAGKIGVPPYFVDEIISQSSHYTTKNLVFVFERLLKTDLELKSSGRPPGLILGSLVIDLCLS